MQGADKRIIETCFSPALFEPERCTDSVVVVIDILGNIIDLYCNRERGCRNIPVGEVEEARRYKKRGYLLAAERDGYVLDFADFGNSPFNFTRERVKGKTIAYSTTNGTYIINLASQAARVVVGSFLNISDLTTWIVRENRDVLLFCAGWKNRFNLEDTICAGAFAERLLETSRFDTICDSTLAALDLWSMAKHDLRGYIEKVAQRTRLRDKGLDDCIDFCLSMDYTEKYLL